MKVVWVLENIDNNRAFYSKLNILLLLASVSLWKRNNCEDKCILFADEMTIDLLDRLKVLEFWDSIKLLKSKARINKKVFWASSKVEVLTQIDEPVIIMDNDTHVYKPIKHLLETNTVYVTNYEQGKGYYPSTVDKYIQQLSYKPRWNVDSVNVSFLYLPDPKFTNLYANLSLQIMEELTAAKAPNPQYLIFSEQLVLKHLLDREKVKNKSIISNYWDCKAWDWGEEHTNGIWKYIDSLTLFKHYGPDKGPILDSRDGFSYSAEIQNLLHCINFTNLNLELIPKR